MAYSRRGINEWVFDQWTKQLLLAVNHSVNLHTVAALLQHKSLTINHTVKWPIIWISDHIMKSSDLYCMCPAVAHSKRIFEYPIRLRLNSTWSLKFYPHWTNIQFMYEFVRFYVLTVLLSWVVMSPLKMNARSLPVTLSLTTKLVYGISSKKTVIFIRIISIPHSFLVKNVGILTNFRI